MTAPVREDQDFAEWYVEHVMKPHHPEFYWSLTPDGLRDRVIAARQWARFYGLRDPAAQAHFVGMMWDVGPNFHVFPGFADVLSYRDVPEIDRVRRFLDGTVTEKQAVHAMTNADESFWWRLPGECDG